MMARRRQQGVILLTLILVILAAGSYVMLRALNVGARNSSYDEAVTQAALKEAKLALIGYAVNTPVLTPSNLGPGRLPCPDLTGDGAPAGGCSLGGANPTTGWFPYSEVGTGRIKDASGADLWYAVAESHRYFLTTPINTDTGDTTDDLSVDGSDDIVAVIIAPGLALAAQDRSDSPGITDFLEGDNASLGDAEFTRVGAEPFNDDVVTITRAELMTAVEKRVLGEVRNRLNDYFVTHVGFPWLSPFADPSTAAFKGVVNTTEGQLPFHYIDDIANGDPNPGPNETNYASDMTISWSLSGMTAVEISDGDPSNIPGPCLAASDCVDPDFGLISLAPLAADTDCTWRDPDGEVAPKAADYIRCTAEITLPSISKAYPGPLPGTLTRKYEITVSLQDSDGDIHVDNPTNLLPRRRTIKSINPSDSDPADGMPSIEITVTQTHSSSEQPDLVDQWIVTADGDTTGEVTVSGVQYDLDIDAGELPGWVIENDWHHLLYFAYSNADSPVSTATCDTTGPCITLRVQRIGAAAPVDQTNNRGVVLMAGRDISGFRPSGNLADYFEDENDQTATPGNIFFSGPFSATFNDQIRSIGTAP
ncbi:MAG: hypothetical protein E2O35_07665 [Proteobacteria bacterium]|nr:MAG: hypothetical protein E2O35_07665 [Pseudomonadota bacterium]